MKYIKKIMIVYIGALLLFSVSGNAIFKFKFKPGDCVQPVGDTPIGTKARFVVTVLDAGTMKYTLRTTDDKLRLRFSVELAEQTFEKTECYPVLKDNH